MSWNKVLLIEPGCPWTNYVAHKPWSSYLSFPSAGIPNACCQALLFSLFYSMIDSLSMEPWHTVILSQLPGCRITGLHHHTGSPLFFDKTHVMGGTSCPFQRWSWPSPSLINCETPLSNLGLRTEQKTRRSWINTNLVSVSSRLCTSCDNPRLLKMLLKKARYCSKNVLISLAKNLGEGPWPLFS